MQLAAKYFLILHIVTNVLGPLYDTITLTINTLECANYQLTAQSQKFSVHKNIVLQYPLAGKPKNQPISYRLFIDWLLSIDLLLICY